MFTELLATHFVHVALLAGVLAAVLAGLLGPLVVARNSAFAVHGIAELGLTGAAGGLLLGLDATAGALAGSLLVGALLGFLGLRGRDRDTATGALLAAGLGLGVLFLSRLHSYATTGFGLLFGSITAVSDAQLRHLALIAAVVTAVLAVIWRPLWYASVDPDSAAARGVPTRALAVLFPVLLAAAVAVTIQVTGVLLILTLVITPAATAQRLTARPGRTVALSVALATAATSGGILASLQWNAPTSFYIATLTFAAYTAARLTNRPTKNRRRPESAPPFPQRRQSFPRRRLRALTTASAPAAPSTHRLVGVIGSAGMCQKGNR
jgi:zinc/manganese transport system permease protein